MKSANECSTYHDSVLVGEALALSMGQSLYIRRCTVSALCITATGAVWQRGTEDRVPPGRRQAEDQNSEVFRRTGAHRLSLLWTKVVSVSNECVCMSKQTLDI